jgi:uncharacterized protein YciI
MFVYKDGRVDHYKVIFKDTSFSASGPSDDFLEQNNAKKVTVFKDHNRDTQKLVSVDPYEENGVVYTVDIEYKTSEEIAADTASKAAKIRKQRDDALKDSDWTQVLDAPIDRTVWANYRQALRDLPDDPNFPNVELPALPIDTE